MIKKAYLGRSADTAEQKNQFFTTTNIDTMGLIETDAEQRLYLDDGSHLLLVKRTLIRLWYASEGHDYKSNVFRISKSGHVMWTIQTEGEYADGPIAELFVNGNPNLIYSTSGFRYLVDLETGEAKKQNCPVLGPWKNRPVPPEFPAQRFFDNWVEQRMYLDDGSHIYLLKRTMPSPSFEGNSEEYGRNVFRIDAFGKVLWRIRTEGKYPDGPFHELFVNDNPALMYASGGFRYLVDLKTGKAKKYDYPVLGPWKKRPVPPEYPTQRYFSNFVEDRVYLDDGTYLFLAPRSGDPEETGLSVADYSLNVFRMTRDGEILWRVKIDDYDKYLSSFTQLFLDDDPRKMANWNGHKYLVDLKTGVGRSYAFSLY